LLSRLSPDERHVLAERYGLAGGEPRTAEAIARGSGMTAARVREIENAALKRLAQDPEAVALRAA
jgi:DNA-directed RNA polymerase sigma subunit (sigma70/sigma32)